MTANDGDGGGGLVGTGFAIRNINHAQDSIKAQATMLKAIEDWSQIIATQMAEARLLVSGVHLWSAAASKAVDAQLTAEAHLKALTELASAIQAAPT